LSGLVIPVFGGQPVILMIASQAFSPMMMPLLIIFLLIMMNRQRVMGTFRNGFWLNLGLSVTLIFSIFMFFIAYEGYVDFFR
jgi:Mn2+/Fe2+ NRAMP family transporter